MSARTRLLGRRFGLAVVVAGLTCLLAIGSASSAVAVSGTTLKVQPAGTAAGIARTWAKVCQVDVVGSGLTPGLVYYVDFAVQGHDAPAGTAAGPFAVTADANGGFTLASVTLVDGHYKVLLYSTSDMTTPVGGSKVIQVSCAGAGVTGQGGTPPPPVVHGPDVRAGGAQGKGLAKGLGKGLAKGLGHGLGRGDQAGD